MFVDKSGRNWSSEQNFLKFSKNRRKYYKYSLAFEDYADDRNDNSIYKNECFVLLKEFRKDFDHMSESEIIEKSTKIADLFEKLLQQIGEDKFTRHDDTYITYIWDNN